MKLTLTIILACIGALIIASILFVPSIYPLPVGEAGAIAYLLLLAIHLFVGVILITPLLEHAPDKQLI